MPAIMGILNVTPDSFSDGGNFFSAIRAVDHALEMVREGASIIDIGGESSRPGAESVALEEEIRRVVPLVEALKRENIPARISVDTCKPEVMQHVLDAGADMINDITALQNQDALRIVASAGATVSLMHMQGQPRSMQNNPVYARVVEEVKAFLEQRIQACMEAGISREQLIIDPGFGFGKTLSHNLELFKHLFSFQDLGCPLLVGVSRKSMVGSLLEDRPVADRVHGSVALALLAAQKGAAILRVHDVQATVDALRMWQAIH